MAHESRLTREMRSLLHGQRVASLGTLRDNGAPLVSMVPYAIEPGQACVVIHVSSLAAHTGHLQSAPAVSLLIMRAETHGEPVHALPRVTLEGQATVLVPGSAAWQACGGAYLQRFPEAEPMTHLDDFMFVAIHVTAARQVAGFGAARSIGEAELAAVLRGELNASDD